MIIVPDAALLEGVPTDPNAGGPYVMWKGTPYAHIMMPTGPRLYKLMIAEGTTLVLSTDTDLFKFLKGMATGPRLYGPPQVVPFAVDLHEHLVEMPPPIARPHALEPPLRPATNEGGEHYSSSNR